MRNYLAVVFNSRGKAYDGLHELWDLDGIDGVTIHGSAVIHRDDLGQIQVDTKETHPALGTGVGVAIGALLGLLAGPAGAAVGAAGGAAIGAASGGVIGVATDLGRADTNAQAVDESRLVLLPGQAAVIADAGEDTTAPIDNRMILLGGKTYRRSRGALRDDEWLGWDDYLYPYEYVPPAYA